MGYYSMICARAWRTLVVVALVFNLAVSGCANSARSDFDLAGVISEAGRPVAPQLTRLVSAHGGFAEWSKLRSMSVDRVHRPTYANVDEMRFTIHAEYGRNRIYQTWDAPPGEIFWDGERAWSLGWPLAGRFSERFLMSSGFFVANFPWLALKEHASVSPIADPPPLVPGSNEQDATVFNVRYEPDVVRKPRGFDGRRDSYDVYVDSDSGRLLGFRMYRTYAGQLDAMGADEDAQIVESYVVDSELTINGLIFPERFSLYAHDGRRIAEGLFSNYRFNTVDLDGRFSGRIPENAHIDNTSSHLRGKESQ